MRHAISWQVAMPDHDYPYIRDWLQLLIGLFLLQHCGNFKDTIIAISVLCVSVKIKSLPKKLFQSYTHF